jgi:hypothetical protein
MQLPLLTKPEKETKEAQNHKQKVAIQKVITVIASTRGRKVLKIVL